MLVTIFLVELPLNQPSLRYQLDYGKCFLNKMYKINFKILNKTLDRYFKFDWSLHNNFVFVPREGHLGPMGIKEITATFFATEAIELVQVRQNYWFLSCCLKINTVQIHLDTFGLSVK